MENARRDAEAPRGTELGRREQLASFARQTPINGFVTLSVALVTAIVLWPVAPKPGVIGWLGLHYALALTVIFRWRRRTRGDRGSGGAKGLRRARLWAALSGSIWGASAGFLPLVPPTYQLFLIVVVGGMAAGASTTLAAVPGAAVWFILSAILPYSAFSVLQGEPTYFGLALMGIVFAIAMLVSSRVVYRTFMESVRARQTNERLLAQFEESRREWLEISETAEGFALFDADDRLLLWNENYQRLLSLPEAAVARGASREALLRAASHPEGMTEDALDSWVRAQLRDDLVEARVEKLGNGRWIRRHARRTEDGRLVTVHVDVTELKRAEEALHESRRRELLGQLTGGVAHDFNNLLTVILGNLELLRIGVREDDDARARVDRAIEAALNGSELTQRLLAFARQQPLSPRSVDVRALVEETSTLVQRTLGPSYDVRTSHADDVVNVVADPTQLTNALLHLGLNARDAMPSGGVVELETAVRSGDFVAISVRDHGQGMSPEVCSRAFEPFFTTKEVGQGSGLGLSMVHGFAEQSGGRVEVQSEEGVSTVVTLYLPRASDDALGAAASTALADQGSRGTDTVLVVEDSDRIREHAVRVLRDAGIRVLEARDGAGALEILDEPAHVDLLLTDVVLPGALSGRDVARVLSERQPNSRILYTSAPSRDVVETDDSLEPDAELLEKPYEPDALVERVHELLRR